MSLGVDLALIAAATIAAMVLRDNLEVSLAQLLALSPYLAISTAVAAVVVIALGSHRGIWRSASLSDYLRIVAAAVMIATLSVAICFAVNRLEGVARAVPILQCILIIAVLTGSRGIASLRHSLRDQPRQLEPQAELLGQEHVLVVGFSRLTEAYLRAVSEFAAQSVRVVGVLSRHDRHVGRLIGSHAVLGTPDQLDRVLRRLEEHGVSVDRIIVTVPVDQLSSAARALLQQQEIATGTRVSYIPEMMGLDRRDSQPSARTTQPTAAPRAGFVFADDQLRTLAQRPYWVVKRGLDIAAAAVLLVALSPLMCIAALLAVIDVGRPLTFWQQRPGLAGRPFRLYKLRTMRPRHDSAGNVLDDDRRMSRIGRLLRRSRMDELPQLYNILVGDMSFVGPRPLLPIDQSPAHKSRLLVRPGLTGWAQVIGGRVISAEDKAALDVWYVKNASLSLDIRILARTVPLVLFGERVSHSAIDTAWSDLQQAGICRTDYIPEDVEVLPLSA